LDAVFRGVLTRLTLEASGPNKLSALSTRQIHAALEV
jgi:hypothetical protein